MNNYENILTASGFSLDEKQPHLGGERRIFAAHKSVLFGKRISDGTRVVIKISDSPEGVEEIRRERICREALDTIHFAYDTFSSPEEILFTEKDRFTIQVTRFIEQDKSFLERSTPEQFRLALKGLRAMEAAHASTYEHQRSIRGIFPTMRSAEYISASTALVKLEIYSHLDDIERYCGFLTHFDYTPQNIRISGETMYLLDHSSLRFGNKHESWARFINFMVLYNGELADALLQYVRDNRATEEYASLRLMRVFRLGDLIAHHERVAKKSEGDLRELSNKRIIFWKCVLESVLQNEPVPENIIREYKSTRDSLRSEEEKGRQVGLH